MAEQARVLAVLFAAFLLTRFIPALFMPLVLDESLYAVMIGEQAAVAPADGGPAFCEQHCPDHDYQYQRAEGHRCVTCFAEPPPDWFDVDY